MINFVEGFRKVQENSVYLARLVETVRKVTESVNKLCFTATALAKTVLEVGEDVIVVEEVYNRAIDNVFHQLTDYTGQGDGSIITRAGFVRFLINRGDVCDLPVGRHGSRV